MVNPSLKKGLVMDGEDESLIWASSVDLELGNVAVVGIIVS